MKRSRTRRGRDKKVFNQTAGKTKSVNLAAPMVYRGGFRL